MSAPRCILAALAASALACAVMPASAEALNPLKPVCTAAGFFSGLVGKACSVAQNPGRLLSVGKKLVTGHVGGAVKSALGGSAAPAVHTATYTLGLAAVAVWAAGGARSALEDTAKVIGSTTSPRLTAPWFSRVYWRVAGISVLLTVPFLFAAAIQALLRSDLSLLVRAAFGYLPLAMLAVAVTAQLTALLLSATDALGALVQDAAGSQAGSLLGRIAAWSAVGTLASHSPFVAFVVAAFTVLAAFAVWVELMMREAAVYVIVAMLPLAFAALVWPARRVWAQRAVELLTALILSKLAIVAVLTLAGAALTHTITSAAFMTGVVLLMLGAFAPWAMVRLVPVAELSAGVAGRLHAELSPGKRAGLTALGRGATAHDWAATMTARMRDGADELVADAPPELRHLEQLAGGEPPDGLDEARDGTSGPRGGGGGSSDGGGGRSSDAGGGGPSDGGERAAGAEPASTGGSAPSEQPSEPPSGPDDVVSRSGEQRPGLDPLCQEDFTWTLDLDADADWGLDAGFPGGATEPTPEPEPGPGLDDERGA